MLRQCQNVSFLDFFLLLDSFNYFQTLDLILIFYIFTFAALVITSIVENYPEQKNFKTELNDQILRNEVENFISAFAALREIEKKAIAEWGEPIAYSSLRKTLSNILVSSVKGSQTTERYGGGCMERALENSTAGTATEADEAVIRGEACAWCGYALSKASLRSGVKATYCSKECSEQGRIRRGGKFNRVRDQLFSLEGGICQKCGINAYGEWCSFRSLLLQFLFLSFQLLKVLYTYSLIHT